MPDFIPPMNATLATLPVRRSRLAVRGQVGRLPRRGGRPRRESRALDPQPPRRGAVFPRARRRGRLDRGREAIVDGEVVALDEAGRPSFSLLQDRTGIRTWRTPGQRATGEPAPVVYQAFDLLHLDGRSLLAVPLEERKRLLRSRLRPIRSSATPGTSDGDGSAFIEAARARSSRASSPSCAARRTSRAGGASRGSSSRCAASRRSSSSAGCRGRGRTPTSAR